MNIQHIPWNRVSKYSQALAIILFVGVFTLGFFLGKAYELRAVRNSLAEFAVAPQQQEQRPVDITFSCGGVSLVALFSSNTVDITLPDNKHLTLVQKGTGSKSRYVNDDESVIFMNNDKTATLTENGKETYTNCTVVPALQ